MTELIGFLATSFVFASFLFKDQKNIRAVNLVGCVLFVIYGIMIGAFWTWLMNAGLIVVQALYLIKGK